MSWSFSFVAPVAEFKSEGDAALVAALTSGRIPVEQAAKGSDAIDAAFAAAAAIVESGVLGDTTRTVSASINGHANTGHAPEAGWANDCITISLTQTA